MIDYPQLLCQLAAELALEGKLKIHQMPATATLRDQHFALGYIEAMNDAAQRILATVREHA